MSSASFKKVNQSNNRVGVVGGGQLAQMLVEAAQCREIDVVVQSESLDDPAARRTSRVILATAKDSFGTSQLVRDCVSVTFENEWVNVEALQALEKQGGNFIPPLSALEPLVDKILQRQLLDKLRIPGPDWVRLCSDELRHSKLPSGWDFPLMAKSGRDGYDGKGTRVIRSFSDLSKLIENVDPKNWLVERWISYEKELAIVASRDRQGKVRTLPLAQTNQLNQVCDWVIAPAEVNHDVEAMAYNIASSLLTHLNYVGVIAIEFFYGKDGLLVNEIAPRTHNSAHFSIEACSSSQFDQQLCIAADLQVPNPMLIVPGALMVNLIGLPEGVALPIEDRLCQLKEVEDAHLHWYEKNKEIPGRKLGHITILLYEDDPLKRRENALKGLKRIRSIWPMNIG